MAFNHFGFQFKQPIRSINDTGIEQIGDIGQPGSIGSNFGSNLLAYFFQVFHFWDDEHRVPLLGLVPEGHGLLASTQDKGDGTFEGQGIIGSEIAQGKVEIQQGFRYSTRIEETLGLHKRLNRCL